MSETDEAPEAETDDDGSPPAIPTSVEVSHTSYRIDYNAARARDADVYGMCSVERSEIIISTTMAPAQTRVTLLHEVLHAICDVIGVSKGGDAALLPNEDEEERLVHGLAPLLLDTLRRNPELVDFLLADE